MSSYLDAIKNKIEEQQAKANKKASASGDKKQGPSYFKPEVGKQEIRLLPYKNPDTGEPFFVVYYYEFLSSKGERRVIAPSTFGLRDLVKERFEKERKNNWDLAKKLKAKERVYGLVLSRKEEEKGAQLWEFAPELREKFYSELMYEDNAEKEVFSTTNGNDWTLEVKIKMKDGKPDTFNGFPKKDLNPKLRSKATKLLPDLDKANEMVENLLVLHDFFKAQLLDDEELEEKLNAFIDAHNSGSTTSESSSSTSDSTKDSDKDEKASKAVDDLFKGLK